MNNDNPTRTVHDLDGDPIEVFRWYHLERVSVETAERARPLGHIVMRANGDERHFDTTAAVQLAVHLLDAVQAELEATRGGQS